MKNMIVVCRSFVPILWMGDRFSCFYHHTHTEKHEHEKSSTSNNKNSILYFFHCAHFFSPSSNKSNLCCTFTFNEQTCWDACYYFVRRYESTKHQMSKLVQNVYINLYCMQSSIRMLSPVCIAPAPCIFSLSVSVSKWNCNTFIGHFALFSSLCTSLSFYSQIGSFSYKTSSPLGLQPLSRVAYSISFPLLS